MKFRKSLNLRTRLLLIFLVLSLAPLMAVGWFSLKISKDTIAEMVLQQLRNVAVDKIALMERWLEERQADMTVIAESSLLKSMDPELIKPYLDNVRHQYGMYRDFTVLSRDGRVVARSRDGRIVPGERDNDIYRVRESLYISEIRYSPRGKESVFYIAAPVFADDGHLAGTVYARVGTSSIVFSILNVSLGKTGECYLVDRDGRFLAHKDPSRILNENITRTGSFQNIFKKRDNKKAYLDYRGIEVLGTSLNVQGTDWYVVVEQDREEAFASARKLEYLISLVVFLSLVSALMLTGIVSRQIIRPIQRLSRYAGSVSEATSRFSPDASSDSSPESSPDSTTDPWSFPSADLSFGRAALKVDRNNAIGRLYRSFEEMLVRLKERQSNPEEKDILREAALKETDSKLRKTRLIAERSEKFAAIGRMGAAVAHEIRTPLTSLKLFLESVDDQLQQSSSDQEDFGIAMGQIQRMEKTINRFLDFARPRQLVFAEIDVSDLIEDVLLMVKPLANRQECVIEVSAAENLPPVFGDRQLLAEALINVLVNALEALPDHGTVVIAAMAGSFDNAGEKTPCVRVDIRDSGHGISEESISAIFEPFFTTKAAGTGLGLSLVLNTIQSHGGTVEVVSQKNEGTTFSLFLPLEISKISGRNDGTDTDHR